MDANSATRQERQKLLDNLIANVDTEDGVPNKSPTSSYNSSKECDHESISVKQAMNQHDQVTKALSSEKDNHTTQIIGADNMAIYGHEHKVAGTRLVNRKRKRSERNIISIPTHELHCTHVGPNHKSDDEDDNDSDDHDNYDYAHFNINDDTDNLAYNKNNRDRSRSAHLGSKLVFIRRRQYDKMVFSRPDTLGCGRKDQANILVGNDGIDNFASVDINNNLNAPTKVLDGATSLNQPTSLSRPTKLERDDQLCLLPQISWILCPFRKLFKFAPDITPPKSFQSDLVELKGCKFRRASANSLNVFGRGKSSAAINVKEQADMLNSYGSNTEPSRRNSDHHRGGRRSSNRNSRRRSSQARPTEGSSPYTKLGYYQYHATTKQSICQDLRRLVLLLIIIALCGVTLWQIYLALQEDNNYLGVVVSKSKLGVYDHYAVSTDAKPCSAVGKNLLAKGGHAVDAAIGTLLCMGVVLPNSLGLGGGCLMTIYDNKTKTATVIDGREVAPDYANETMFAGNQLSSSRGPLSVGVPGELAAYWEAHQRFGKLKWSELFAPSIVLAEQGSPMVEHLSFAVRDYKHAKYITAPLREIFANKTTNQYYKEGDIIVQEKLAQTLKRIRDFGVDEFYNGTTGRLFIEDLQKQGGKMTMENLQQYRAIVKQAMDIKITDDLRLYTQPTPGSGIVLSIILRVMKELGYFRNYDALNNFEDANLFYHHLAEAFKFAYAQRAALEDHKPDDVRMKNLLAKLQSSAFIKEVASKIDNKTHPVDYYGGLGFFQEDHGTAHTSVIDSDGNSVAVTTSVNLYFGSGLVSPSTGIIYNDVMDDFVSPGIANKFMLAPSKYNHIEPGKRPLSSMAPSVFVDHLGNPKLVVGASGGSMITTAIATVSIRNIFLGESIKVAIDAPRPHHQYLPNKLMYESNFPIEHLESLANRGHELNQITGRSSVVMGIACNYKNGTKTITANSDHRKGGSVDGL